MEIGLLHKPYVGTASEMKAYQSLVVAACVVKVDGRPLPSPLTNEEGDSPLRSRWKYVRSKWASPTWDAVYERLLVLDDRAQKVIEQMGKAPGWTDSPPTSTGTSA